MAKHTMMTFRLHRTGVILVIIGCVLVSVLLFAAGFFSGMLYRQAKVALPAKPAPPAATATTTATTAPAQPAAKKESFALRVGLLTNQDDAKAMVDKLAAQKQEAAIVALPTSGGAVVYSVQVGQYGSRREAADAAEALRRDQGTQAVVVPSP